jgi:Fe-S-cluster containining protein
MKKIPTGFCNQCGVCCKLFLINLSEAELLSGIYDTQLSGYTARDNFKTVEKYGGNILRKNADGSCIYLYNNRCSIHAHRPKVCRNFFCDSRLKKYREMNRQISEALKKSAE